MSDSDRACIYYACANSHICLPGTRAMPGFQAGRCELRCPSNGTLSPVIARTGDDFFLMSYISGHPATGNPKCVIIFLWLALTRDRSSDRFYDRRCKIDPDRSNDYLNADKWTWDLWFDFDLGYDNVRLFAHLIFVKVVNRTRDRDVRLSEV